MQKVDAYLAKYRYFEDRPQFADVSDLRYLLLRVRGQCLVTAVGPLLNDNLCQWWTLHDEILLAGIGGGLVLPCAICRTR